MDELRQQLSQLIEEACKHPPRSRQRRKGLTEVVRLIEKSGKLSSKKYNPGYEDALQQTWLYFSRNICEGSTGAKYDSNLASVTTWLNRYLEKRLLDSDIEQKEVRAKTARPIISESGEIIDPIDNIAAEPDIPSRLEKILNWVETDPDGELSRIHIKGHPEVTCQVLILRRLPPEETQWKDLVKEFGVGKPTLSSFYERQCRPRLRKFGESEEYL